MAYRAEIQIGVKGVKQLDRFQSQLERLSNEVDRVNKKKFTVGNLSSYNEVLRKANETLNQTEIETSKAGKATGLYKKNLDSFVTALLASNSAQDLSNKLVRQEIQDRGAATQTLKSYNAELAATTQRGAQTTMVGSYLRGQPKFGPEPAPGFDPVAGAARTRASGLAADAIAKGKATEQAAQEEIRLVGKVNEADRRAFIALNNDKIRLTQKRLDLELDASEAKLSNAIKSDNEIQANFDKRLNTRIQGNKEVEDIYLKIREDSEKRIESQRRAGLQRAKKLEQDIVKVRADRSKRQKDALSSALIGGAFPLLFGQGAGASIGGAIGGGAGGLAGGQFGFGLSLVGTQIGVLFDQLAEGAKTLGQSLNTLTADIDAVVAASGNSNTVLAKNIKALEEAGLKNTALALATQELSTVVGGTGVNALKEFGSDSEKLGQSFTKLMTQMQADFAGLANSLGILRAVIGGIEDAVLFRQSKDSKDPRVALARAQMKAVENQVSFKGPQGRAVALEQARQNVIKAQRQVIKEEALNIENLSKQALVEKKNLDLAKQNLGFAERALKPGQILKQFTDKQKEQEKAQLNFQARRNEIVANYEKSIGDLRRNIEGQVSNLRLQNLQKANQLEDQRAANVLAGLRNQQAASNLFTAGTGGVDPALRGEVESLKNAADVYALKVVEAEQKRAKLERDAALTVQEIQFRADKFKLDVAKQAAELGLNAQKQIDRINKTVVERNSKFNAEKFRNEVKIASLRLEVLMREINFEAQKLNDQRKTAVGGEADDLLNQLIQISLLYHAIEGNVKTLDTLEPPQALTEVQGLTQAGVDLTEYNKLVGVSIGLQDELKQSRLEAISGDLEAAGLKKLKASAGILSQIQNEAVGALAARNVALQRSARLSELTAELGSQALAEEITSIEFATSLQMQKIQLVEAELQGQQALLESKIAANEATQSEIDDLEHIKKLLIETGKLKSIVSTASETLQANAKGEIGTFVEQATNELNNLEAVAVSVSQGIGNAIGSSLANGISGLIEGSATVKEVFADMLKSIGQTLVQEGTKMIATYIAIGIAKAFAGMSGGKAPTDVPQMTQNSIVTPTGFSGQFAGMAANGGPVEGGRPYLVGERGPELFVPGQSGGVMRNEDMRSLMGRSPASGGAPSMNFSFETTSIGGTEYVSREQLESAMAVTRKQASNDGAKRGMSMTLDKMQNSPRTRSKIGLR